MPENPLIRKNLMTEKGYSPYCGGMCAIMPRTIFTGRQFKCEICGWHSEFPEDFINKYKAKWNKSEVKNGV